MGGIYFARIFRGTSRNLRLPQNPILVKINPTQIRSIGFRIGIRTYQCVWSLNILDYFFGETGISRVVWYFADDLFFLFLVWFFWLICQFSSSLQTIVSWSMLQTWLSFAKETNNLIEVQIIQLFLQLIYSL